MSDIPDALRYTTDHEWAEPTGGNRVRIGITDYAQAALGDIVFVSVHEVGASVAAGDTFGEVESTKSVSDLYAPVAGRIVARNESLDGEPELVNREPYAGGWIVEMELDDASGLDGLLDAGAYREATGD